jgi:hypothetical protein
LLADLAFCRAFGFCMKFCSAVQVAAVSTLPNSSLRLRKHLRPAFDFWPYSSLDFQLLAWRTCSRLESDSAPWAKLKAATQIQLIARIDEKC